MRRRDFLAAAAAAGAVGAAGAPAARAQDAAIVRKGRIKQGLWRNNFGGSFRDPDGITLEQMCAHAQRLGAHGFDLVGFDDIPLLERYGLKLLLTGPGDIDFLTGVIHAEHHDEYAAAVAESAAETGRHGVPSMAFNAGQLRGLSKAEAADNAVAFLTRVAPDLEAAGVTLCLENVNDRRPDEPGLGREDMAFGHWDWGVDVCRRVGSPNVKLICDIYHLQIMDGDVVRRIQDTAEHIGHFHVAGVPTRREIGPDQELNYRYIAEVIAELDYDGYVSHEWRPSEGRDPLDALAQAMDIMDV